ncbi:MAG: hypothetical protein ACRYGP_30325 [Janthinobacterium lividum]
MQLGPALSESNLTAVGAWWAGNPRAPAPFDQDVFLDCANGLMTALTPLMATGNFSEAQAALVKAIAAVASVPVFHGTDNDVFKLSLDLREEIYSQVMTFRRAVLHDVGKGAFDA